MYTASEMQTFTSLKKIIVITQLSILNFALSQNVKRIRLLSTYQELKGLAASCRSLSFKAGGWGGVAERGSAVGGDLNLE